MICDDFRNEHDVIEGRVTLSLPSFSSHSCNNSKLLIYRCEKTSKFNK